MMIYREWRVASHSKSDWYLFSMLGKLCSPLQKLAAPCLKEVYLVLASREIAICRIVSNNDFPIDKLSKQLKFSSEQNKMLIHLIIIYSHCLPSPLPLANAATFRGTESAPKFITFHNNTVTLQH